jgi:hypothetical protein
VADVDDQRQYADEPAGGGQIAVAGAIQTGHADDNLAALAGTGEIERHGGEQDGKGRQSSFGGKAAQALVLGAWQGLADELRRRQFALCPVVASLDERRWHRRQTRRPVSAILGESRRRPVGERFLDEVSVRRSLVGWRRNAGGQRVVDFAPTAGQLGRAPAIHDRVVKLDGHAMQVAAAAQQDEAPGGAVVRGKRLPDFFLPPLPHGLLGVWRIREVNQRQIGFERVDQTLAAVRLRHQAQCLGFRDQQTERLPIAVHIERPDQEAATADIEVAATGPGPLIEPDFALAERQRQ